MLSDSFNLDQPDRNALEAPRSCSHQASNLEIRRRQFWMLDVHAHFPDKSTIGTGAGAFIINNLPRYMDYCNVSHAMIWCIRRRDARVSIQMAVLNPARVNLN